MAGSKVTAKSIITNGIINGWTIARIVKAVQKAKPKSAFSEQVVRIYASALFKNKEINAEQKDKYLIRKKVKKAVAPKKKAVKKAASKKKVVKKKK